MPTNQTLYLGTIAVDSPNLQKVDGGGDLETKAHWQGNDFVVERRVKGGGKVTEDYLRSQDGKQLFVIVGFEGSGGRSIQFRRVYDPAS